MRETSALIHSSLFLFGTLSHLFRSLLEPLFLHLLLSPVDKVFDLSIKECQVAMGCAHGRRGKSTYPHGGAYLLKVGPLLHAFAAPNSDQITRLDAEIALTGFSILLVCF